MGLQALRVRNAGLEVMWTHPGDGSTACVCAGRCSGGHRVKRSLQCLKTKVGKTGHLQGLILKLVCRSLGTDFSRICAEEWDLVHNYRAA